MTGSYWRTVAGFVAAVLALHVSEAAYSVEPTEKSPPPVKAAAEAAPTDAEAAPAEVQLVPDRSLTLEEYVKLGVPPIDREWKVADREAALKTLRVLALDHPEQLPRYKSERSGELFAKLAEYNDVDALRDKQKPLDERMPAYSQLSNVQREFFQLYRLAYLTKNVGGDDLLELMGALLRNLEVGKLLIEEFIPTLSPQDPTYSVRMGGLKKMQVGAGEMARGAIICLHDQTTCTTASRLRLIEHCRATFPRIVPFMPEADQAETLKMLKTLSTDEQWNELRPSVVELYDAAKAAAEQESDAESPSTEAN